MKIISGRFKGRNFYTAKGSKARPTSTKVRGALFNILYNRIYNAVVVDLFAGSGGFGLEALSRGASKVCYCDYDKRAIHSIQGHLDEFRVEKKEYSMYPMEYKRALTRMETDGVLADIIYIDPPYSSSVYSSILAECIPIINIDGTVIVEHDRRATIEMAEGYSLEQTKQYGNTTVSIFRYEGA
ncbi:MAG: 16S rRNA (guanine(966)-N(2))-methyltransferase RsmD [Eubacteriales bacterium]